MEYSKFKRGSEWRKWDLHIHTPETKKNDQFEGNTPDEKWEKFIEKVNSFDEEIAVVGITDYFSIENYFKFKKFISEGKVTARFELVLPNIELRVVPVTGSSTPINLHCIFNPIIENEINTRFLSKLKFDYSGSNYSAKSEELIRLGKALPGNTNLDDNSALKAGINQYVISMDTLRNIFEMDKKLRENTIVVISNKSTDGVSGIRKHSDFFINDGTTQLDATRWSIYQFADAIFSSNENDVLYFTGLGVDKKELVIEKCRSLKPCYHGSDAHSNDTLFEPFENRFCWIKADPTFEGLKQTLYEPIDRVKIQTIKPDAKNDRYIISELQFIDEKKLFGKQKIYLNENLNAIIGGKSSGKSLLLYSAAKSIDPEQVEKSSKRLGFEGYKFESSFDFEVTWKNGDKDVLMRDEDAKDHKITFIPQLYINYLVEKNNKTDLNNLIANILLQDSDFRKFYDDKSKLISDITSELDVFLSDYLQTRSDALEILEKLKTNGQSATIKKSIEQLQKSIERWQTLTNLNELERKEYNQLLQEKINIEKVIRDLDNKESVLRKILVEIKNNKTDLFGQNGAENGSTKGKIDRIIEQLTDVPDDISSIRIEIEKDYTTLVSNLETNISELKVEVNIQNSKTELTKLITKLEPYQKKISGQKELQKLSNSLESENQKLQTALNLEKQYATLIDDYDKIRSKMTALLKNRFETYSELAEKINTTKQSIGSEIFLKCSLVYYQIDLPLFEQVNKAAISREHYFNSLFADGLVNYPKLLELFSNRLRVRDDKLDVINGTSIPLKQKSSLENILRGLLKDSFSLDYTVTYRGDDLLNMSPGKKGTVLLILFLQISSSEYPILIDQPEDNLDNRTIYELLCEMVKEKKKDRQIIVVSHNANLVVSTDAENVIVANQEGQEINTDRSTYQFEYVTGSLEFSFSKDPKIKGILYQQGIKEHACDILEGGVDAFKQREKKYSLVDIR